MREQEPPDCWDMEFSERAASPKAAVHKPWRGAAAFIPKVSVSTKKQPSESKQVRAHQNPLGPGLGIAIVLMDKRCTTWNMLCRSGIEIAL